MRKGLARTLAALLALATLALSAKTVNLLEDLVPEPMKKPVPGYTVEGHAFHFRDRRIDVRAEYLTPAERAAWFGVKGVKDPFAGLLLPDDNYVFFKVRFENLQKEDTVEFTPGSSMFGSANVVDDIAVYQMFYRESDGEARLAAAGQTLFFKALHLPPGQWIERLVLYKYDETYRQKRVMLVLSSILLGRDGLDLEFPFLTTFKKEKKK